MLRPLGMWVFGVPASSLCSLLSSEGTEKFNLLWVLKSWPVRGKKTTTHDLSTLQEKAHRVLQKTQKTYSRQWFLFCLLPSRGLQDHWNVVQSGLINNIPESRDSNLAFSDVLMAIKFAAKVSWRGRKGRRKKDRTVSHIKFKLKTQQRHRIGLYIHYLYLCVCVFVSPVCTFGVIKMDGFKVVDPYFPIKLIQHGLHSPLGSQVVALNNKETMGAALIVVLIFHGFISRSFASTSTAWYGQNCLSQKSDRHILSLTLVLLIQDRLGEMLRSSTSKELE